MPGISGIIGRSFNGRNEAQLDNMIGCMMHESFYSRGSYINHDIETYIGWVSHAGSFCDCMPIYNENKDIVLFFAGEEFADINSILKLKTQGHTFDPSGASYLIHLYEEDPNGFFRNLNGWFSGVLVDFRNQDVFLFIDRYGMQRVYFHETEDQLFFSSEAKSLLKILPELRRLDPVSLGHYLACGSVLEDRSLFSGVSLLPGGSSWKFHSGKCIARERYFRTSEWENQEILEKSRFFEQLCGTIQSAMPRYFASSEPIGISLTGGLDTRTIMAYAGKNSEELTCYTFGGMYRECYDVKVARRVAKLCHRDYKILPLGEEFLSEFETYAEKTVRVTDAVLDVCGSHEIYLNRLARDIAPIRMTGLFGSETLRSVDYTKVDPPVLRMFDTEFEKEIGNALETFKNTNKGNPYTYVVFKLIPWMLTGRVLAAQSQLTVRTPFMDNDLLRLMYQAPEEVRSGTGVTLRLISNADPRLGKIPTDRGLRADGFFNLSLIARPYYEFLFKAEYYLGYGMPNWLSIMEKHSSSERIQQFIVGRHKIDNYRLWFKDNVSRYIKTVLLDNNSKNRPYLKKNIVDDIVSSHMTGDRNYTKEINRLLTVELAQRIFIEGY